MMPQHQPKQRIAQDPVLLCVGLDKFDQNLRVDWLPVFKAVHCGPRAHGINQLVKTERAEAIAVSCNSWADVEYVRGLRNGGISLPILFVASEEMSASIPPELKCGTVVMVPFKDKKELSPAFEGAMATAYANVKTVTE